MPPNCENVQSAPISGAGAKLAPLTLRSAVLAAETSKETSTAAEAGETAVRVSGLGW